VDSALLRRWRSPRGFSGFSGPERTEENA
jgi:hypothetical protein